MPSVNEDIEDEKEPETETPETSPETKRTEIHKYTAYV